jgi:hypothetical protein
VPYNSEVQQRNIEIGQAINMAFRFVDNNLPIDERIVELEKVVPKCYLFIRSMKSQLVKCG